MEKSVETKKRFTQRKRLGEYLIAFGLIDEKTLVKALDIQKIHKKRLGRILMDMGVADDEMIAKALASQLNIPLLRLDQSEVPTSIRSLVPFAMAEHYQLIPMAKHEEALVVAMADPLDLNAIDDLRFVTGLPIEVGIAPEGEISRAIERCYGKKSLNKDARQNGDLDGGIEIVPEKETEEQAVPDLMKLTELPPVVRLANTIIADAVNLNASDIHIEPQRDEVAIRYRVDGILRRVMKMDKHVHASLVSRIKVISKMDISIRRKPQDGRSQVLCGGKSYDLRVSTIRILDQSQASIAIDEIGFSEDAFEKFSRAISRPQGIILVTGPTGSGKSTTLYACLNRLNSPTVNITTVEDPVEYDIPGVNQVHINSKAGITFAAGLRSILRQDPDIVMVGEIRDAETASTAFRAAQTGHLVFSTLHTNDAPSAVVRLLDLGVEPFNVSASLTAVVAQRLVRRICPNCKIPHQPALQLGETLLAQLGIDRGAELWMGAGCEKCQYTGYSGRLAVFELLVMTPTLREIVASAASTQTLRNAAEEEGLGTMTADATSKVLQGLTTLEEILRVAPPEELWIRNKNLRSVQKEVAGDRATAKEPKVSLGSERPKKILVADDNEIMLKIVCNVLESENYATMTAINGLEAMKLAIQELPDLIITDFLMPEMDGKMLARKLKSQLATQDIPIIMVSAKDEEDPELRENAVGVDDYLTKPINPKVLLAKIDRLLKRRSVAEKKMTGDVS
jgi:type IV pilus assembly protein PilB